MFAFDLQGNWVSRALFYTITMVPVYVLFVLMLKRQLSAVRKYDCVLARHVMYHYNIGLLGSGGFFGLLFIVAGREQHTPLEWGTFLSIFVPHSLFLLFAAMYSLDWYVRWGMHVVKKAEVAGVKRSLPVEAAKRIASRVSLIQGLQAAFTGCMIPFTFIGFWDAYDGKYSGSYSNDESTLGWLLYSRVLPALLFVLGSFFLYQLFALGAYLVAEILHTLYQHWKGLPFALTFREWKYLFLWPLGVTSLQWREMFGRPSDAAPPRVGDGAKAAGGGGMRKNTKKRGGGGIRKKTTKKDDEEVAGTVPKRVDDGETQVRKTKQPHRRRSYLRSR